MPRTGSSSSIDADFDRWQARRSAGFAPAGSTGARRRHPAAGVKTRYFMRLRRSHAGGTLHALLPGTTTHGRGSMTTNTAYRIENLDVYRKSIALGTRLYQAAGNGKAHSAVGERVRENTLALVLNVASGLGFWEKQWKTSHFAASKRAVMEMTPLLELMVALGEMKAEAGAQFA